MTYPYSYLSYIYLGYFVCLCVIVCVCVCVTIAERTAILGVLGILRSKGLKLVRSKDDAGVIDRPCLRAPLRGKPGAYALNVHSGANLDCVFVYLPNIAVQ